MRSKISASSFISAMLRSRCVFSMTFAASATLIDDARCTPAVDDRAVERRRRVRSVSGVLAGDDLHDLLERVLLVARVDPLGRVAELEVLAVLQARRSRRGSVRRSPR